MKLQAFVPALQHLAKFPGANRTHVAKTRGLEPAELEVVLIEHFGGISGLDEESFKEFTEKNDLNSGVVSKAPAAVYKRASVPEPVKRGGPTLEEKELALWNSLHFHQRTIGKFRPVLEVLRDTAWEKVRPQLKRAQFSVTYSSFYAFSLKVFLSGGIHPGRVQRFMAWAEGKGLLAKRADEPLTKLVKTAGSTKVLKMERYVPEAKPAAVPEPVVTLPAPMPTSEPQSTPAPEPHEVMRRHLILDCRAGFEIRILRLDEFMQLAKLHFMAGAVDKASAALEFAADECRGAAKHCQALALHDRPSVP